MFYKYLEWDTYHIVCNKYPFSNEYPLPIFWNQIVDKMVKKMTANE